MDSTIWFDTLTWVSLGVSGYNLKKNIVFYCLKIYFTFTNSVEPDEMQHYAAFHLGLHCLQKYRYSFRGLGKGLEENKIFRFWSHSTCYI